MVPINAVLKSKEFGDPLETNGTTLKTIEKKSAKTTEKSTESILGAFFTVSRPLRRIVKRE